MFVYEHEYENFPLKWLSFKISVWVSEYLYPRWKEGYDPFKDLESFYDGEDAFDQMRVKCISTIIGFRRVSSLEGILKNYRDERYASVIMLALTQIEGVIWDLAITLHNIEAENIFDQEKVRFQDIHGIKL